MSRARDIADSAATINALDGVTATGAELNILDGVTATTAELNYVDGVTSAIQTQIDAKATYPSQTGNSGKFLTTDGSTASWANLSTVGGGGSTTAVPVTLTSSSDSAHNLTATSWGREVTLPDATTMSEGTPVFFFNNRSRYDIPILNNGGTLLGFVLSGDSTMCSLVDKSTSNGKWVFSNPQPLGTYAEQRVQAPLASSSNQYGYEKITDTKWMLLHMNGSYLYASVYDMTTRTFGSFTNIHSDGSNGIVGIQKLADNTALIVYSNNGATSVKGVVATVSGTTISLGTVHTRTVTSQTSKGGRFFKFGDIDANGIGCVSISRNSSNQLDVIGWKWDGSTGVSSDKYTFNGTNYLAGPIGNTGHNSGFVIVSYNSSSSVLDVQSFYVSSTGNVTNISGTTVSNVNADAPPFMTLPNSNGNVMLQYKSNTGVARGMIVKTTTSSITASTGAPPNTMTITPDGPITYMFDSTNNQLITINDLNSRLCALYIADVSNGTADVQNRNFVSSAGAAAVGFDDDSVYVATSDQNNFYNLYRYYVDDSAAQEVPNREHWDAQGAIEYESNQKFPFHGTRVYSEEKIEAGRTTTFSREQGGQTYIPHGRNYIMESERYAMVAWGGGHSGGLGAGMFDRETKAMIKIDPRRLGNMAEACMGYNNRSLADASEGWDIQTYEDIDSNPTAQYYVKMSLKRLANA